MQYVSALVWQWKWWDLIMTWLTCRKSMYIKMESENESNVNLCNSFISRPTTHFAKWIFYLFPFLSLFFLFFIFIFFFIIILLLSSRELQQYTHTLKELTIAFLPFFLESNLFITSFISNPFLIIVCYCRFLAIHIMTNNTNFQHYCHKYQW